MEIREVYLIFTLISISLICILSLVLKSNAKKELILRLDRYKKLNITVNKGTIQGHPIKIFKVKCRRIPREFVIFKSILKESIDDFFNFSSEKNLEPKVLKYIILPLIFTYFFVRITDSGDSSLNVIINVYNTTLYYILNKLAVGILTGVVLILVFAIVGRIFVKEIKSKYDKMYLTTLVNLTFILILTFAAIMFLGIIIIVFGNYDHTDIFIPLYYTMVIAVIELFNKFLRIESYIKIFLSVIVVFLMFVSLSEDKYEHSGGYYFYTTNQTVYNQNVKQNFNSISKEIDIEINMTADGLYCFTFNDKYKLDNKYLILNEEKNNKDTVVKSNQIKNGKIYYLGEYDPKTHKVKRTCISLKFSNDKLTLQKNKKGNRIKLHFVRDGSMSRIEVGDNRLVSDNSGADYYKW